MFADVQEVHLKTLEKLVWQLEPCPGGEPSLGFHWQLIQLD